MEDLFLQGKKYKLTNNAFVLFGITYTQKFTILFEFIYKIMNFEYRGEAHPVSSYKRKIDFPTFKNKFILRCFVQHCENIKSPEIHFD